MITSVRMVQPAAPLYQLPPGGHRPAPLGCRHRGQWVWAPPWRCVRGREDILGKRRRLTAAIAKLGNPVHRISSPVDVGPFPLSPCEEEVPLADESAESHSPQAGKARRGALGLITHGPPAGTSGAFPRSLALSPGPLPPLRAPRLLCWAPPPSGEGAGCSQSSARTPRSCRSARPTLMPLL